MDALKKAEKARGHEDTRSRELSVNKDLELSEEPDLVLPQSEVVPPHLGPLDELSLEPVQSGLAQEFPGPLEKTKIRSTPADFDSALNIELDATDSGLSFEHEDSAELPFGQPKRKGPGLSSDEDYFPEDTSATLPSLKAARRSVDDYFDGTRPMTPVRNLDDDTTITTQRDAVKKAHRDSAKTVIGVKQRASSGRGRRIVVFSILPLIILVGGGVGYYYWWNLTAVAPLVVKHKPRPTPKVASREEVQPPEPSPPASDDVGDPNSLRIGEAGSPTMPDPTPSAPAEQMQPAAELQAIPRASVPAGLAALASGPKVEQQPVARTFVATVEDEPPSPGEEKTSPLAVDESSLLKAGQELMAAAVRPGGFVPGASVQPFIKIAKKHKKNTVHPMIRKGYQAFQNGDFRAAGQAYGRALRRAPKSRDALLGIAATAHAQGELEQASRYYQTVLQLNPRDSVAQAALLSLKGNLDPIQSVARIRILLDQHPQADYLHFGLGNVFAGQKQWPAAQESYFKAYSLRPINPDYAFNLAVSLDHMSQRGSALQYYERALELADADRAGFQVSDVLARIQAMRAAPQ